MATSDLLKDDYIRLIKDFKNGKIRIEDVKDLVPAESVEKLKLVKMLPVKACLSFLKSSPTTRETVNKIYEKVYNKVQRLGADDSQAESYDDSDYLRVINDWKEGTLFHTNVVQILSKEEVDMLNKAASMENPEESIKLLKSYPKSKEMIEKIYQNIYSKDQSSTENKAEDFYTTTITNFLQITGGDTVCRKNGENMTPLAEAALIGDQEKVKAILGEPGIDTNEFHARDESKCTPLMMAAIGNHPEIVKLLIDKGANIDGIKEAGDTALILAARRGNRNVVELLVENGADLEAKGESDQPAVVAAREGIGRYLSYYTRARRKERRETLEYLQDEMFKDFENEDEAESGDEECDINDVEKEETNPFKAVYSRGALYEVDQKNLADAFFYNVIFLTTN